MKERITWDWAGHSEMTALTPRCSCGWKGETIFAWQEGQVALLKDQELAHYATHRAAPQGGAAMSEPVVLTREEFEDCMASTSNYKRGLVFDHDAALRAQLAQVTAERDAANSCEWIEQGGAIEFVPKTVLAQQLAQAHRAIEGLEAQLQAMKEERTW